MPHQAAWCTEAALPPLDSHGALKHVESAMRESANPAAAPVVRPCGCDQICAAVGARFAARAARRRVLYIHSLGSGAADPRLR